MDSMSGVKSGGYTVTKVADQCAKDCCGPMCTKAECNQLCIHMYTCDKTCYDFNNGHICKHIHRVHTLHHSNSDFYHNNRTHNQTSSEEMDHWKVDSYVLVTLKSGGYTESTKVADPSVPRTAVDQCAPKLECNQLCIHMYTCDKACYDLSR